MYLRRWMLTAGLLAMTVGTSACGGDDGSNNGTERSCTSNSDCRSGRECSDQGVCQYIDGANNDHPDAGPNLDSGPQPDTRRPTDTTPSPDTDLPSDTNPPPDTDPADDADITADADTSLDATTPSDAETPPDSSPDPDTSSPSDFSGCTADRECANYQTCNIGLGRCEDTRITCDADADCAFSEYCFDGRCVPSCEGSTTSCGPGLRCETISADGHQGCVGSCNPVDTAARTCAPDTKCIPSSGQVAGVCVGVGAHGPGDSCQPDFGPDSCQDGSVCQGDDGAQGTCELLDLDPEIASATSLQFRRVSPRPNDPTWEGAFQVLTVQNTGIGSLEFDDIHIVGADSDRFRVTFPSSAGAPPSQDSDQGPQTLASNASFEVRVWFKPDDEAPATSTLKFDTNDPDDPDHPVDLQGNPGGPCLDVVGGDELAFGQVTLDQVSQKTVTLENCSRDDAVELSDITITDDGGGVYALVEISLPGQLPDSPATIDPGERATFVVIFAPEQEQEYDGQLVLDSNDSINGQIELALSGRGSTNECPTANVLAAIAETSAQGLHLDAEPLQTVQLNGNASTDPDGTIARYEWTILDRPQGSTQPLLPTGPGKFKSLFIDLAGHYEIELKVYDDQGAASCGAPAIVTIDASVGDDVHIQLVWDTPADPDQMDETGADLDLHYLHPNGQWGDQRWDVFFLNKNPDWGTQGNPSDDPSLDIDDTNGAGPESISHSGLKALNYQVGVYYYNGHGYGASYATLRVYVGGILEFELEDQDMPGTSSSHVFWKVAAIEGHGPSGPPATVTSIDVLMDPAPSGL